MPDPEDFTGLPPDPNLLPPVLPPFVARTLPSGEPTKELLDWEFLTREWYKQQIVYQGGVNERLSEFVVQLSDTDPGGSTADAVLVLKTEATPVDAIALFGVYLKADTIGTDPVTTGMEMLAYSNVSGVTESAIGFSADRFYLTDAGNQDPVFEYTDGVFRFFVPVEILNEDIAPFAVSNQAFEKAFGLSSVEAILDVRPGARVIITASTFDTSDSAVVTASGVPYTVDLMDVRVDGNIIDYLHTQWCFTNYSYLGGSNYQFTYAMTPATRTFSYEFGQDEAGLHTFRLEYAGPWQIGLAIHVVEQADA